MFTVQSSFINQHLLFDTTSKFSYLDTILLTGQVNALNPQTLYLSFIYDAVTQVMIFFTPMSSILQVEYQEATSTAILIAPELTTVFTDYTLTYYSNRVYQVVPTILFDSFFENTNFFHTNSTLPFLLFIGYIWFLVYLTTFSVLLKYSTGLNVYLTRLYYYFYSMSIEIRFQFEALFQTMLFFLLY